MSTFLNLEGASALLEDVADYINLGYGDKVKEQRERKRLSICVCVRERERGSPEECVKTRIQ